MVAFQRQELGLPEDEAGLRIFSFYFVPYDAENEVRQAGICFRIELQTQKPPGFASIVTWNTFNDLEGRSSCMTDKAVIQVRRKLVLRQIVGRDVVDRLLQFLVAFDHIGETYAALSDRIQKAATPFLPSRS